LNVSDPTFELLKIDGAKRNLQHNL
jgi:hypothetical protein